MFEKVRLYEGEELGKKPDTNEEEYHGYIDPESKQVRFDMLIDWFGKIRASENSKYLKCLNWSAKTGIVVNSIVGITVSENVMHRNVNLANAVKIAFKEGGERPAMPIAEVADKFNEIDAKFKELGVDTSTVGVFTENEKGKLTQFCWYYDTDTDTAVIAKNMHFKAAAEFIKTGTNIIARVAKKATTSKKDEDDIATLEAKIAELQAKKDAALAKMNKQSDDEWAEANNPFSAL